MRTFYDGEIITASDINNAFGECATIGATGRALRSFTGPLQTVGAGASVTVAIVFNETYAQPPIVLPGFAAGSEALKGSISARDITTTGATLRIDNLGTTTSKVTPACLVVRI